ncbi:unnamed protein product [Cuscuta campestris]|uniref:Tetraspanin n=1 Tax=Cuscuta campestris TaxID=132261 RepID=A0A484KS34_9ASTE|nr:unnamed protein product [Cuscuta campestris]
MVLNKNAIGAINLVALLLSVPIIATGIWLMTQAEISCLNLLNWPVIALGIAILVVAIFGIVGGFRKIQPLMVIYFVAMLVLMVLLGALVAFVFSVTSHGSAHREPNRAYLEYRFDDYSGWLGRQVHGRVRWARVWKCLSSSDACVKLNQTFHNAQDFFNAPLSPVQSGCCKPPTECGYTYVTPTYWISPINMTADKDCLAWSNNDQLCYGCDSCRAGMLASLRKEWRKAGFVLLATLFFLACVCVVGFCVFRRSQTDELFRKYKQGQHSSSYT